MRSLMFLLVLIYFNTNAQTICDPSSTNLQIQDSSPGCLICDEILNGNNAGFTPENPINFSIECGTIENSVWYSFYNRAGTRGTLELMVENCKKDKGLEIILFDENLNPILDCSSARELGPLIRFPFLEPWGLYYVLIDGNSGDECDFELVVSLTDQIGNEIEVLPIAQEYCLGAEVCFSVDRLFESEQFIWDLPLNAVILDGGSEEDSFACLRFDTKGSKEVLLQTQNLCGIRQFSTSIEVVDDGFALIIDELKSSTSRFCVGDEIELSFDWDRDSIEFIWNIPSEFQVKAGGGPTDTFVLGDIIDFRDLNFSVKPDHPCGLTTDFSVRPESGGIATISVSFCQGDSFYFMDSWFKEEGTHILTATPPGEDCQTALLLEIEHLEVFPSPEVDCQPLWQNGISFDWQKPSGVDSFQVFINRNLVATTTDQSFIWEDVPIGGSIDFKLQPFGNCDYLPAEITCSNGVSNAEDKSLNDAISIFPNPTAGQISIDTDLKIESVEIYDLAGRFIQKEKTNSFELENRSSGIYFLKIKTKKGIAVKRIIVQ